MEEKRKLKNGRHVKDEQQNKSKYEFGGPLGGVMMIISPLIILAVNISCSNQPCSFTKLPDLSNYTKLESWVSVRAFRLVSGYLLLQLLISQIPYFGKRVTLPDGKKTFVANSMFALFAIMGIGIAIEKLYYPISDIIYDDYIQICVVAICYGLLLAFILYIKGSKAKSIDRNPYGHTGNVIYDFVAGREINPTLLGLIHVKVLLFRNALVAMLLINLTWLYRYTAIKNLPLTHINLTLLLFCAMQIIYLLDTLHSECYQVSTFEFLYEGCGFLMSIGYFIYPFIPTILTKRILDQDVTLPNVVLIGTLILFVGGLYIYHASNTQKSIFRKDSKDPQVAHLKSIPTPQGKRLLVSGWWGFVRHPNYLGDLMVHTAWAVGCYNTLPIYATIFTYGLLIDRTKRDADRCSQRYGEAWKTYSQLVPYRILPLIY